MLSLIQTLLIPTPYLNYSTAEGALEVSHSRSCDMTGLASGRVHPDSGPS